ncbi:CCC_1a_G0019700.mRNA.1.CDS.1 [Saccharomyces cerevisiae]|nr:CCC_1a_G0019700.mRNA.1.CDS.1 [Saccharomyces cerevisiae]CAI7297087.1 CCC_1a_G0019700.mRNA.1.CDS.1 [Saccharomyces cerevisiae]
MFDSSIERVTLELCFHITLSIMCGCSIYFLLFVFILTFYSSVLLHLKLYFFSSDRAIFNA